MSIKCIPLAVFSILNAGYCVIVGLALSLTATKTRAIFYVVIIFLLL